MNEVNPILERYLQRVTWGVPLSTKNLPPIQTFVWKDLSHVQELDSDTADDS